MSAILQVRIGEFAVEGVVSFWRMVERGTFRMKDELGKMKRKRIFFLEGESLRPASS
jgi:hypothetical protein